VPYAHLDTQWRWAYPQVIREYIANTLTRNFDLIDKYPHYIFNFSGSRRYEMMKEYYPADYQKLKNYIRAGRWFPCGSSVDEGDANVPSGESLIRHVLYGNHYFRKEFGVASEEFMLPDCFGFPYALPSILAHCGIKGFSTQKLTWGSANGIPFKVGVWEGPDGKSVVAALDPGAYSADITEDLSQNTSWLARIQNTGKLSGAYVDYHYYGTGDTGGAPRPRAVEWVEKSIAGTGPITVVSAKADEMFKDLKPSQIAEMPRYKGELLLTQHSAGSISSEGFMKRSNRKSELLADAAERSSVAAMLFGGARYPSARLYNAWDLVLGSQMHDMLPGTSIPKAYEFCWNDFLLAQNQFASVETDAVGAVAKQLNTRGAGVNLVVYNPLSIARHDLVEATIPDISHSGALAVKGPDGKDVPAQILSRDGETARVAFSADVPATGFASFTAHAVSPHSKIVSNLRVDARHLENARFRVTVNAAGDIASIFDKQAKREVLKAPSRLELQYENPGQYPAWNMDWADAKLPPREVIGGPARITILENGPVRVALRVERQAYGSKYVQDIRLTEAGQRVEVLNNIDWKTKERALKASFPLNSGNPEATYDLQLGATKRGNNNERKYEVPQHQWFDLTKPDGSYGAGILNDCKFASDKPDDDTVRLTLIYTPGVRGGFEDQATQDFGRNQILYAIAPHTGDWRQGQIPWQAKRLNQPLRAFLVSPHFGPLGKSFSLLSTSSGQVEVQAVKKAEDSDEIIVRLRELDGSRASHVKVRFAVPVLKAREVNGQEQPLGPATIEGGALVADVPAYSLKTFALKLGKSETTASPVESKAIALKYDTDVTSTSEHPGTGEFAKGRAIAAEMLPSTLSVDGVSFAFGPKSTGAKNALSAHGQTVAIPKGYSRVYLITAADGDTAGIFKVGNHGVSKTIENWRGYVGQWDNRIWAGDPGPNFGNYGEMIGLTPGYVKPSEVAWFASHCHVPSGNTYYDYNYLYKVGIDVPTGATTLTLPNNPRIKVLAVSVARSCHDTASPVAPLSDTLADHRPDGAPTISPSNGSFSDATAIRVDPPLYYRTGSIRYTLDGSTPAATSPLYKEPIVVNDPTTIKVAQVDENGHVGQVSAATIQVHDTTPPSVVSANASLSLGVAKVVFSEPVSRSSAEDVTHYKLSSGDAIAGAKLSADKRTVELTFAAPVTSTGPYKLTVDGVQDLARTPNSASSTVDVSERGAVFSAPPSTDPLTRPRTFNAVKGLPIHAGDSWTLNLYCKVDKEPQDRTIIGGFGRSIDGNEGTGRYFAKFPDGISLWVCDRDVFTHVPLSIGSWQMLTATYDGATIRLFKNGEKIAEQQVKLDNDSSQVRIMPLDAWERTRRLGGEVRDLTVWDIDLPETAIKRLWESGQH
jgi:alpha-mannosidase